MAQAAKWCKSSSANTYWRMIKGFSSSSTPYTFSPSIALSRKQSLTKVCVPLEWPAFAVFPRMKGTLAPNNTQTSSPARALESPSPIKRPSGDRHTRTRLMPFFQSRIRPVQERSPLRLAKHLSLVNASPCSTRLLQGFKALCDNVTHHAG